MRSSPRSSRRCPYAGAHHGHRDAARRPVAHPVVAARARRSTRAACRHGPGSRRGSRSGRPAAGGGSLRSERAGARCAPHGQRGRCAPDGSAVLSVPAGCARSGRAWSARARRAGPVVLLGSLGLRGRLLRRGPARLLGAGRVLLGMRVYSLRVDGRGVAALHDDFCVNEIHGRTQAPELTQGSRLPAVRIPTGTLTADGHARPGRRDRRRRGPRPRPRVDRRAGQQPRLHDLAHRRMQPTTGRPRARQAASRAKKTGRARSRRAPACPHRARTTAPARRGVGTTNWSTSARSAEASAPRWDRNAQAVTWREVRRGRSTGGPSDPAGASAGDARAGRRCRAAAATTSATPGCGRRSERCRWRLRSSSLTTRRGFGRGQQHLGREDLGAESSSPRKTRGRRAQLLIWLAKSERPVATTVACGTPRPVDLGVGLAMAKTGALGHRRDVVTGEDVGGGDAEEHVGAASASTRVPDSPSGWCARRSCVVRVLARHDVLTAEVDDAVQWRRRRCAHRHTA